MSPRWEKKPAVSPESDDKATATPKLVEKVYRANSKNYALEGWKPEKRDGSGKIIESSQPLRFTDFLRVTDDPAMQAFIEASDAFKNGSGEITLHKTVTDAMREVNRRDGLKRTDASIQSISEDSRTYRSLQELPAGLNQPDVET
jgi:hypothetical protein